MPDTLTAYTPRMNLPHVARALVATCAVAALAACGSPSGPAPTTTTSAPSASASPAATPTEQLTLTPAPVQAPPAPPATTAPPAPVVDVLTAPLTQASSGRKVRELQARLRAAKTFPEIDVTDTYGPATAKAVAMFQELQGLSATSAVDQVTWDRLINATPVPSDAELNNQAPGKPYVRAEIPGLVKEFQHRLLQLGLYAGPIDGQLSQATKDAAVAFQASRSLPAHGVIDERTWRGISQVTRNPTVAEIGAKPAPVVPQALDPRCNRPSRTVCVSMAEHKATYLVDGSPVTSFEGRFGSESYPTYPGVHHVHYKDWTTVSTVFGERFPMPYAMFFHDDRAIHFSFDFVTDGFNGNSHGCVNMRDYETLKWLYDQLQVGDPVIIY